MGPQPAKNQFPILPHLPFRSVNREELLLIIVFAYSGLLYSPMILPSTFSSFRNLTGDIPILSICLSTKQRIVCIQTINSPGPNYRRNTIYA
jgi:hypothetical protein